MVGKVSWFNKRFGLAEGEDGIRYFLHHTEINNEALKSLGNGATFEGQHIEFETAPGITARGMTAKNIRFA